MSRLDDDLRGATAPLARERLPDGMMDESLSQSMTRERVAITLAVAAAAAALVVVLAWGAGRWSLPIGSDGSPSGEPRACDDIEPIGARSKEYRVYFPCAAGSGIAGAPRVMGLAAVNEALAASIRDLLDGPTAQELEAGMAPLTPAGSGDLLTSVELEADGLAVIAFDARLGNLDLDPRFLDAVEATGLQFDEVTALELRLDGRCADLFALFGAACDHLAKPLQIAGDCPVIPPAFLPSGAGITSGRPFPDRSTTVSWGSGNDTVTQDVGERGGPPFLEDGQDVVVRGYPGRARPGFAEFAWVEGGCPYYVTLPGQDEYAAQDYATVYGPVVAQVSATPLPSAPIGMATVEEDGIRVTLVLDRESSAFGQRVWADVTVENTGSDVVHWGHSGSCVWPAGVQVWSALEPPPIGRTDWPGDHGVLKNVTVSAASSVAFGFTPEEFSDFEGGWGCTSDLVVDELEPGQDLSARFAWDTIGLGGMPLPGGRYVAESVFYYMARGTLPPDANPSAHAVTVRVALDVAGPAMDYLGPGEAMDLLLADPDFTEVLAANPRERWTGADLRWIDERWVLELGLDAPSQAILASVNALTGAVSDIELVTRDPQP